MSGHEAENTDYHPLDTINWILSLISSVDFVHLEIMFKTFNVTLR